MCQRPMFKLKILNPDFQGRQNFLIWKTVETQCSSPHLNLWYAKLNIVKIIMTDSNFFFFFSAIDFNPLFSPSFVLKVSFRNMITDNVFCFFSLLHNKFKSLRWEKEWKQKLILYQYTFYISGGFPFSYWYMQKKIMPLHLKKHWQKLRVIYSKIFPAAKKIQI